MHFLQHLLSYMVPIQAFISSEQENPPEGDDHVITSRGNFVITSRSTFVIAKKYI